MAEEGTGGGKGRKRRAEERAGEGRGGEEKGGPP